MFHLTNKNRVNVGTETGHVSLESGAFPQFECAVITAHKRSLGQGNIFGSVCREFCSQGEGVCLSACWDATLPLWADTPGEQPPRDQAPPQDRAPPWSSACWEIQLTSGRYASYWNAILCQWLSLSVSLFIYWQWKARTCPNLLLQEFPSS